MKILIKIQSASELICYEAVSLAMTMATFEHNVQLWIEPQAFGVIMQTKSRISGMIKSLPLYDLPPAWIAEDEYSVWFADMLEAEFAKQCTYIPEDIDLYEFDKIMTF